MKALFGTKLLLEGYPVDSHDRVRSPPPPRERGPFLSAEKKASRSNRRPRFAASCSFPWSTATRRCAGLEILLPFSALHKCASRKKERACRHQHLSERGKTKTSREDAPAKDARGGEIQALEKA